MAQGQLAAQVASIDELRSRVGTLVSAASVATGFLAGQALDTSHGVPAGAWLGIVSAFALILACAYLLKPREWAGQSVDTTVMLEDIASMPNETIAEFQQRMAGYARAHFVANREALKQMYWVFTGALLLLCADFAGWIWALVEH
jgi:hypothetical protein